MKYHILIDGKTKAKFENPVDREICLSVLKEEFDDCEIMGYDED